MTTDSQDDDRAKGPEVEGGGQSAGVPSDGAVQGGSNEPLGRPGRRHWRESTITEPGLNDRGNVFFAAIEMTRMPMILTDPNQPDNPIVFANKAFLDLTAYEESEILGRNCRFLQGAQTDREAVAELREAVKAKESIAIELLNYRRDGTPFWNAVFIGPVYDVHGTLLYFFASQLDITRRRDTEQSYRQAQKMEAIGQLTAGLAHDFNNLLQVVNGNLELLGLTATDDRSRRYVDRARTAAERGAKLTRQLLAFARKTRLEPRVVELPALVAGFVDVIHSSIGRELTLSIDLPRDLPPVSIDVEQLEMALLNVLMNARDAMPGGGAVRLSGRIVRLDGDAPQRELAPGAYVALEVKDGGEGMPPEVVERAAEPFFTTKGVGKGTGLGLAMVSGFARQSRGRMELESEVGRGTTVRLLLPIAHSEASVKNEVPEGGPAPAATGEHVLVVEDSAEVLELATEILTDAGYRVTTAMNGEEALKVFDTLDGDVDLLFTDLVMPGGMNGIVLADEVGRRKPGLPVLMTTGYNEELVAVGAPRPSSDVLGKPYRQSELLDRVRRAIDGRGSTTERRRRSDFGAVEA